MPRKKRTSKKVQKAVKSKPALRMTIFKPLKWTEGYLLNAKKRMPGLILPARLRSFQPTLKRNHVSWGSCDKSTRTITLATHKVIVMKGFKRNTKKRVALSDKEILMTLAHELAHLRYDKHGYEQESYARTIFHAMGVMERCPTCDGKGKVLAEYKNE